MSHFYSAIPAHPVLPRWGADFAHRPWLSIWIAAWLLLSIGAVTALAQSPPLNERVLVVYNADAPESHAVAEYYMSRRAIPERNACRIKVSSTQAVDQEEYESHVRDPVRKCLDAIGKEKILYIVFSYQTPYALTLQGRTYSLDQFVADIWDEYLPFRPALQPDVQPYLGYAQSEGNAYAPFVPLSAYRETSGARHIFSVWRIDAATSALAKGLVDKALFAEAHRLSGKACFDLNSSPQVDYAYGAGNWDIYQAAQIARKAGLAIVEDAHQEEFGTAPAPLRCDGVALYAGWYSLNHYNDAFTWNPGAVGLHLDSASAVDPRGGPNWAANAVMKGITVTSGAVSEPFLENLPHPDQAFLYLFEGANAGDALLRSTRLLKWMILNIGDPLYRPFPNGIHIGTAPAPEVILALLPQITLGDSASAALVGVSGPDARNGFDFSIKTDRTDLVDVPQSVSIPAGADHAQFRIHTRAVHDDATTARIFVAARGLSRSNTLVLFPMLAPLTLNPVSIRGRASATGALSLRRPAPAGGVTVALSSSNPAIASVRPDLKVPEGQTSATFQIATHAVIAQMSAVITASYAGVARSATLTVVP